MEIALTVLAVWLLGNAVAMLAWGVHRGAFTTTRAQQPLPSVAVPAQRVIADAPVARPARIG